LDLRRLGNHLFIIPWNIENGPHDCHGDTSYLKIF
jgi:hypothetical protein